MALSKELLDILACPQCKQPVELTPTGDALVCRICRLAYPVEDDIPVMLVEEAQALEE